MLIQIRNSMKNQKGFTLVELMVVIAIIGVLAAIAVPKFTSASENARGAKMQADLRTIDSAVAIAVANGATFDGTALADVNATAAAASFLKTVQGNLASQPKPPAGQWRTGTKTPTDHTSSQTAITTTATYGINADGRAVISGFTADTL